MLERYSRLAIMERIGVLCGIAAATLVMAPVIECAARFAGIVVALVMGGTL